MTVNELISTLQTMSPDAKVEFQIPHSRAGDREPLDGARAPVTDARETFYNEPENKWVVLSNE